MSSAIIPIQMSNGRALWGTHALWVTVLDAWQRRNGHDGEEWHGIEFDKLAHLLHLMWSQLRRRKLVSFDSAYTSAAGVHGPGPALPLRGKPNRHVPALDAIQHIQDVLDDNPDMFLFELRARQFGGKRSYRIRPGRERTYLPIQLSNTLPPAWTPDDQEQVNALTELVAGFSQPEIRALGTHQSYRGTLEAIEYNVYIHLFYRFIEESRFIASRGTRRVKDKRVGQSDLPALDYVVNEIRRKASLNRREYTTAWQKLTLRAEAGDNLAAIAQEEVFEAPDKIWVGAVVGWLDFVPRFDDCSSYLASLKDSFVRTDVAEEEAQARELRRAAGETARDHLVTTKGVTLPVVPRTATAEFRWSDVRRAMKALFDGLPGETEFRQRYDSVAARVVASEE